MYQEYYQQDINELKSKLKENQQQLKAQLKELNKIKRENFYELFGAQNGKAAELWVLLCLQKQLINKPPLSEQEFRDLVNKQITDKVHQQSDIIRNKNKSNKKMSKTERVKKETRLRQEVLYLQKLATDNKLFDNTLLALNRKECFSLIFSQFVSVWDIFEQKKREIYEKAYHAQDLVNEKEKEISSQYEEEVQKIEDEFNKKKAQKQNDIYKTHPFLIPTEQDILNGLATNKNMILGQLLLEDPEYNQLLQEKDNKQNQIELEKQSALSNNSELIALKKTANIEDQKASIQEEKEMYKIGKVENIINKVNATICEVQDITEELSNRQQEAKIQKQNTNNIQPIQEVDEQYEIDEEEKKQRDMEKLLQEHYKKNPEVVEQLEQVEKFSKFKPKNNKPSKNDNSYINHWLHIYPKGSVNSAMKGFKKISNLEDISNGSNVNIKH